MKTLLHIVLLLGISYHMASAQHSVFVSQKGNGNKVTINQSKNNGSAKANSSGGCNEANKDIQADRNSILIKHVNGQSDTLVNVATTGNNNILKMLNGEKLTVSQHGRANGLSVALPDSQKVFKRLQSTQTGTKNHISARLNKTVRDIDFSQNGTKNNIAVNPCNEQNAPSHSKTESDSLKVNQKGSRNSATIIQ